jgi:hypothetical protein
MPRARFTQADIDRAIRAMEKLGRGVAAIDFPAEGGFRLILGEPLKVAGSGANEWDEVLPGR